ncbi:hypothetical protein MBCUT_01100 [Methanobrevibacter cuticularis]|uniref:Uncharacterized protein n=1 Tax=Methanobrevibacter cuticularis TaxID=47311 RepID=A0A166FIQ9_9EURY|nr:hypothetical protein MBCUT_01100 [Methanobrevibacter cuticularis]
MKVIFVKLFGLSIAPPVPVLYPFRNVMFMKVTFKLLLMENIRLDPSASIITSAADPFPWIVTFLLIVIPVLLVFV